MNQTQIQRNSLCQNITTYCITPGVGNLYNIMQFCFFLNLLYQYHWLRYNQKVYPPLSPLQVEEEKVEVFQQDGAQPHLQLCSKRKVSNRLVPEC